MFPIRLNPYVKKPRDVFKNCPECKSPELHPMDVQVSCLCCGWDSFDAYERAGGLDYWEGDRIKKEAQQQKKSVDDIRLAESKSKPTREDLQVAALRPTRRHTCENVLNHQGTGTSRHSIQELAGF